MVGFFDEFRNTFYTKVPKIQVYLEKVFTKDYCWQSKEF